MQPIRPSRRHAQLADGREIVYYDDPSRGSLPDPPPDRRDLPPVPQPSDLRRDELVDEWTIVAAHRQGRTFLPPTRDCPLCPSRGESLTEIPASDYDVAVFENRFASLAVEAADVFAAVEDFPFRSGPGVGRCEVVCFTSDHDTSFAQLSQQHARTVIDALADRTAELSRLPEVRYVFCFENRGEEIGVTLSHPHGQIYGYPFVPPRMLRAAQTAADYQDEHGECLRCELLKRDVAAEDRVISRSEHWTALVPFAARWPYEARLIANRHVGSLPELTEDERDDLAGSYLDLLRRFDRLFDTPTPYIAGWHQAPVRQFADSWHLGAEVFTIRRAAGKLKYLAGSESGAAVWINDITPESAAARLRGD